jgi:hypothetical protein
MQPIIVVINGRVGGERTTCASAASPLNLYGSAVLQPLTYERIKPCHSQNEHPA